MLFHQRIKSISSSQHVRSAIPALFVGMSLTLASIATAQTQTKRAASPPRAAAEPFSTENEKCIVPASMYHGVNYHVLRAILVVESGLNPRALGRNDNGTMDVGMGQYNSMHFKELAKFGIAPGHLMDACVSTYVTAWHLKKNIVASGNSWEGIARYHSATPYFNQRYQILLKNELIRSGALSGSIQSVPSIRRGTPSSVMNSNTGTVQIASPNQMIVADSP